MSKSSPENQTEEIKDTPALSPEEKIRQLSQIICICKGIPLKTIIRSLEGSETVNDVNQKTGAGSGGCRGERCGPKIRILLKKKKAQKAENHQEKK